VNISQPKLRNEKFDDDDDDDDDDNNNNNNNNRWKKRILISVLKSIILETKDILTALH